MASLDRPDMLVFDLDPDPNVEWKRVVETALLVRDKLIALGHVPLLKTTGGKGLHVCCVPSQMTWSEGHTMGHELGEALAREFPDAYVTNISKAKRKGKILLDFSRNHPGITFVAPYSPRARANAPVATPLGWDELDSVVPQELTIRTVIARLEKSGDRWAQ
jgi:bifunctional non-homologous end joining protein LigD